MTYDVTQEAVLKTAAETGPITYANAVDFGEVFGKSTRSVIAKIKSLDLPYTPKPVPAKRPKGVTKAEVVTAIEVSLGVATDTFAGLDKATAQALSKLLDAMPT